MKKIALFLIFSLSLFVTSYGQKIVKYYEPAYVINTETLERVAKEAQLRNQSPEVQTFLIQYPILDDLSKFSKRETYSMINSSVICSVFDNEKAVIYVLKNGKKYKVKKKKQTAIGL